MKLLIDKSIVIKPDNCSDEYWDHVVTLFQKLDKDYCLISDIKGNCITIREQKCKLSEEDMEKLLRGLDAVQNDITYLKCTKYSSVFFIDAGQLTLVIE